MSRALAHADLMVLEAAILSASMHSRGSNDKTSSTSRTNARITMCVDRADY